MSKIEKLIAWMMTVPKNMPVADLDRIMAHFGYVRDNGNGGSGVKYRRLSDGSIANFHLPHRANTEHAIPTYVIRQIIEELKKRGDL